MISTTQMTKGNNGSLESNHSSEVPVEGLAKYTRNSTSTNSTVMQHYKPPPPIQSAHLLDLPQEIIEKIFCYLSFKNICQLRLVCRSVDYICGQFLNFSFIRLQNKLQKRFEDIKATMPRRESARRSHYLACESGIIETLYIRMALLQMSFGNHIRKEHCCFFPGEILDEVYRILHYIKVTPKLDLSYKVTDELFDLSTMAVEYFKDKIEPNLPEIGCFGTDFLNVFGIVPSASKSKNLSLDSSSSCSTSLTLEGSKNSARACNDELEAEDLEETILQSNMVLKKRIRNIKRGMKRYNSQLSLLRQDMRTCKRKISYQQKQISEQQKQLADQQKQTLEYATRLDDYDKKNVEMSRKCSTLLQELNKYKTEMQYWRCNSLATPPFCHHCGNAILPQPEELQVPINQVADPEGLRLEPVSECLNANVE